MNQLIRENTRILRPWEYKALEASISKKYFKTILRTALLTGMRHVELRRFQQHPEWFDDETEFIYLPEEAVLKHERKQVRREIRLNPLGKQLIPYFLDINHKIPDWQGWKDNLKRWADYAKINPIKMSVKTTRKTWESWLLMTYPERVTEITLSQGHTSITSIKHYQGIAFTDKDREEMKEFVEGWI